MVNNHYIPQFILRNFCVDNKITYCDLDKKRVELRNTRSIFSEHGYYSDEIEKELCEKTERLFADLYHNKLENAGNSITLTPEELFVLKKYLIVTSIRYRYEYSEEERALIDKLGKAFTGEFEDNIHKILECDNADNMFIYLEKMSRFFDPEKLHDFSDSDINAALCVEIKDVLHSYIVFVRTGGSEKFLIPDVGKGIYEGPMSRRKMYGLLETGIKTGNYDLLRIAGMLTPHDYTVYPLSKDMAVMSMSTFFKLMTESEIQSNVILPADCPTLSSVLGFGNKNVIKPPNVRINRCQKEYRYEVQRISGGDVCHLNCLMLAEAKTHIACAGTDTIKSTLELINEYSDKDYSFIKSGVC